MLNESDSNKNDINQIFDESAEKVLKEIFDSLNIKDDYLMNLYLENSKDFRDYLARPENRRILDSRSFPVLPPLGILDITDWMPAERRSILVKPIINAYTDLNKPGFAFYSNAIIAIDYTARKKDKADKIEVVSDAILSVPKRRYDNLEEAIIHSKKLEEHLYRERFELISLFLRKNQGILL